MFFEELVPGVNLESRNVEFKGMIEEGNAASGKSKEMGWLKTMAAFANTEGGNLYIGVDNRTHTVLAMDHTTADKTVLLVHRKAREHFEPAVDYDIQPIPCTEYTPTRYVLNIVVRPSRNVPVMVHEGGLLGIYVRSFGETVQATPEQIREMVLMSDNTPYDRPFVDAHFRQEDFQKLFAHAKEQGENVTEEQLMSIGFLSGEGCLSKGALLFADACSDLRTKAVATAWPGITKGSSYVTASETFVGNLLDVIAACIAFVRNRSNDGFEKQAAGRSDYVSFPARSVTEGVVNAVGHRNYYIQGSQIEVNVFRDRLEITSPGSLLGVRELRKEKNISQIIPRRRNDVICAVLELCHYMEEKGSGFDKIAADYAGYGEAFQPYISANASSFTLTLPDLTFRGGVLEESDALPDIYTEVVLDGKNDLQILSFCYAKPRTAREIADSLSLQPSTYFRKNVLGRLVERGLLLERKGEKVATYQSNPEIVKLKR